MTLQGWGCLPIIGDDAGTAATTGSESMSSRHQMFQEVSAIATGSCCRWKKEILQLLNHLGYTSPCRCPTWSCSERGLCGHHLWSPSFHLTAFLFLPSVLRFAESSELGIMYTVSYLVTRMLVSRYCYVFCNYPHFLGKETEAEKVRSVAQGCIASN